MLVIPFQMEIASELSHQMATLTVKSLKMDNVSNAPTDTSGREEAVPRSVTCAPPTTMFLEIA